MTVQLFCGDCLEIMKEIESGSVDLVIIDPPYNIKKAKWDSWKTVQSYVDFMGSAFLECQRVLKDNGSFYFFHNDFLQIVELQNWINSNCKLDFQQLIVWNKRCDSAKNKGFLDGFVEVNHLRNYQQMAEYCLFYTKPDVSGWDWTGLQHVKNDPQNFKPLRRYFEEFQKALGLNKKQIIEKTGQCSDHCFRWKSSQWDLPTEDTYKKLCDLPLEYEFVRKEYEELRKEYEELRYTFNNQKTHHSVWDYEIAKKEGHCTPKPVELIENIIKHSSNENDIILDCFMGSGTTGVACVNTNRNFIGIEKDEKYFEIAKERIAEAERRKNNEFFIKKPTAPTLFDFMLEDKQ